MQAALPKMTAVKQMAVPPTKAPAVTAEAPATPAGTVPPVAKTPTEEVARLRAEMEVLQAKLAAAQGGATPPAAKGLFTPSPCSKAPPATPLEPAAATPAAEEVLPAEEALADALDVSAEEPLKLKKLSTNNFFNLRVQGSWGSDCRLLRHSYCTLCEIWALNKLPKI